MPIPYNISSQISMLWEKGIVGGQKLLYFLLNQRVSQTQLDTTALVDDTSPTTDTSWWQVTSGLAAMEKAGFLKITDLPSMQIQWYIGKKPQPMQLEVQKLINDRSFMQPETYLKLALSSQGDEYYSIDPTEFCTKFGIDRLDFLAGLGGLQDVMGVYFDAIPVTMTQQGYLNLRSLTPDSLSLEKRDFLLTSPIWTFIVLRLIKGSEATQAINPATLVPYGITESKLNTDLIRFNAKELLKINFADIVLIWKSKPSPLPATEILTGRGKLLTELGYLAQALSTDGRLRIPQAEFCDRWSITATQLIEGLNQLRSAGILDFSLGGNSVTWLI